MAGRNRKKTTTMIIENDRRMLVLFTIVIMAIVISVGLKSVSLYQKIELKKAEAAVLLQEKEKEEKIEAQNADYAKEVQTLGYAEEYGRSKLGLVYPGEVVFKGN
ncbi:MAG: septum formation initiator family protein [Acetatifactor sp.]